MSIKSIKIKNILSFDNLIINNFEDMNCFVGQNNTGKSNLLKCIQFFYNQLVDKREIPLPLKNKYSSFGTISIVYDISYLKKIVMAAKNFNNEKLGYFKKLYNTIVLKSKNNLIELTLKINHDNSISWDVKDINLRAQIYDIYPFFAIETRHIDLYDWNNLWNLVSRLKPFNPHKVSQDDVMKFFNEKLSENSNYNNYEQYINEIENIIETGQYSYKDKVLSYVKTGLTGQSFLIESENLDIQSDGTNSYKFLELFITLLIALTRKSYITPILFVDEPEIGLHPKKNEELFEKIYNIYSSKKNNVPYPKIMFSTHSSNIVKEVIKLFNKNHQVIHVSKLKDGVTNMTKMNSKYKNNKFINIFNDNEARLFFSKFILFVEGTTELELFRNRKLLNLEPKLKAIDVYATNKLILDHINPSYSNMSIPYLVIYDSDKFIKINFETNVIDTISDVLNLKKLYKAYKRAYSNSSQHYIFMYLKKLFDFKKNTCIEFTNNIYFNNLSMSILTSYMNDNCLLAHNHFTNKTTIEELLINKNNFHIFKKWLFYQYISDVKNSFNSSIPTNRKKVLLKNKIHLIKSFIQLINDKFIVTGFHTKNNIFTLFILLFNGKTETLISKDNKNWEKYIPEDYRKGFDEIENYIKDKLKIKKEDFSGKTSGWVTKFLDFAITEIESNTTSVDLEKELEKNFEELYVIIKRIKHLSDR